MLMPTIKNGPYNMNRFYKLNEIENFKGDFSEPILIHFILLLYSEYLLENCKFGWEGNDFYWAIKDYVAGYCLPATLKTKEEKVRELSPIIRHVPKFNARSGTFFDQKARLAFLTNTSWRFDEETQMNNFIFEGVSFSWKSSFIKLVFQDGKVYFACYSNDGKEGCHFHIKTETSDTIVNSVEAYPFSTKNIAQVQYQGN